MNQNPSEPKKPKVNRPKDKLTEAAHKWGVMYGKKAIGGRSGALRALRISSHLREDEQ